MAILDFNVFQIGQTNNSPQMVFINTDNSYEAITASGYLNGFMRSSGSTIRMPAFMIVGYVSVSTGKNLTQLFNLEIINGNYDLVSMQGGSPSGPYLESILNLNDVANKATSRQNLGVEIGVDVQEWSSILDSLSNLNPINLGLIAQTSAGQFSAVTLIGTANKVTVTNGNGANGNPTFTLADNIALTGITLENSGFDLVITAATLFESSSYALPSALSPVNAALVNSDGLGAMQWAIPLLKSGGTMTGGLILNADPTNALQAATKQYVDARSSGLKPHADVAAVKNTALTVTYNNGTAGVGATLTNAGTQSALVIDGYTVLVNDRLLIANQAAPAQNGIYVATNVGSVSTNWVLTRATDFNAGGANNIEQGAFVEVVNGTLYAGSGWTMPVAGPYVVGTTALTWINIYSAGNYSAGTGIDITDFVISIANTGTAGTYVYPASMTTNAQGQVTAITAGTAPLHAASNLSDVANAATSRTNLGVAIGTNVQAHSANLDTLAAATPATGFAALDSGGNAYHFRSLTSANSTLSITNPAGTAGNPSIIIPNGANNSLAGYSNSGVFSGVTVGSGLSLSAGTLTATGGGSGSGYTFIGQYELRDTTSKRQWDFTTALFPAMADYGSLHFMFSNVTHGVSSGGNQTHFTLQVQTSAGVFPFSVILSTALPAYFGLDQALYGSLDVTLNIPADSSRNMARKLCYSFATGTQDADNPPAAPNLSLFLPNAITTNALVIDNNPITGFRFACDYGNDFNNSLASGYIYLYGANPI